MSKETEAGCGAVGAPFEPAVRHPLRYNGFTCPKCGSHMFGTHKHYRKFMGDRYEDGASVGKCNEHQYSGNGCDYEWDRSDRNAEDACMYSWSREDYEAHWTAAPAYKDA